MTTNDPPAKTVIPLNYGRPPQGPNRKFLLIVLVALAGSAVVILGVHWIEELWRQHEIVKLTRQCTNYVPPPGMVAFDSTRPLSLFEDDSGPLTLIPGPASSAVTSGSLKPAEWLRLVAMQDRPTWPGDGDFFYLRGLGSGTKDVPMALYVFLQSSESDGWIHGPAKPRSCHLEFSGITLKTECGYVWDSPASTEILRATTIKIFAATPDGSDPRKFKAKFAVDGVPGEFEGYLGVDGMIHLNMLSGPNLNTPSDQGTAPSTQGAGASPTTQP